MPGCGQNVHLEAESCGEIPPQPSLTLYELGERYGNAERIEQVEPCQPGEGAHTDPGASAANEKTSISTAPIAFKAVAYRECAREDPSECWYREIRLDFRLPAMGDTGLELAIGRHLSQLRPF